MWVANVKYAVPWYQLLEERAAGEYVLPERFQGPNKCVYCDAGRVAHVSIHGGGGSGGARALCGQPARAESGAVCALTRYASGHCSYLLGAWWPDEFSDWPRRYTLDGHNTCHCWRGRLLRLQVRTTVGIKRKPNFADQRAGGIKGRDQAPAHANEAGHTLARLADAGTVRRAEQALDGSLASARRPTGVDLS
jgi:hypothetical protein